MIEFSGKGKWQVNPGDSALCETKIDIKVIYAMSRMHQCATVQLDFRLAMRFDLQHRTNYNAKSEEHARPAMANFSMISSVERVFVVFLKYYV